MKSFLFFNSLNKELSLVFCLVDNFPNQFSFHSVNHKDTDAKITYCIKLDSIYENSLIISNTSIKNNIATLISYIRRDQEVTTKTVYYAMNVTPSEAEIFTMRYSINHTVHLYDVINIIVITDAILAAKQIFDMFIHPHQLHSIIISNNLRELINKNSNNLILFWDCSSSNKWPSHFLVDKELTHLKINPILLSKLSWKFSRKKECNFIIHE